MQQFRNLFHSKVESSDRIFNLIYCNLQACLDVSGLAIYLAYRMVINSILLSILDSAETEDNILWNVVLSFLFHLNINAYHI